MTLHFMSSLAFWYSGVPLRTTEKPLIFRALRAAWTATIQVFFLPMALLFLLTIRPALFFTRSVFFRPVAVFVIFPKKAWRFASRAETGFFAFMALRMAARMAARIAFAIWSRG